MSRYLSTAASFRSLRGNSCIALTHGSCNQSKASKNSCYFRHRSIYGGLKVYSR